MTEIGESDTFGQLLNIFWLRPETALWREVDIRAMRGFEMVSPSLDLGCGDGNFSFVRAGGEFNAAFDCYQSLTELQGFFRNADVFDSPKDGAPPIILRRPGYRIDVGFDHKPNLLRKAERLGLYGELRAGDAAKKLPFESGHFNSIFSNIVYWLDDPAAVLNEIRRILSDDGTACLMLPDKYLSECSFYENLYVRSANPKWEFLKLLDRGRFSDNIRQARDEAGWKALFDAAGLSVVSHQRHLSDRIVRIWDIGLRPLFPVLIKMVGEVPSGRLEPIKTEWISTLRLFLDPLLELERSENDANPLKAFHCFVLRKK